MDKKKELYQKTEKALNHAFDAAKQSIKILSEKAGEAASITKLMIEKASVEHRISKKYTELGSLVFVLAAEGEESVPLSDAKVKKAMAETKTLAKDLAGLEKKIEKEKKKSKSSK